MLFGGLISLSFIFVESYMGIFWYKIYICLFMLGFFISLLRVISKREKKQTNYK